MPYERYTEVDLDHGCVIDKGLWQRVQDKVKELDESRAQATKHCFPLSGLLYFVDGSNFTGSSAWGKTKRSTYYHNKANKIRVRTEVFEHEAEKILHHVADSSPKFQKSVADYSDKKDSVIGLVVGKIAEIDTKLGEIAVERQRLDRRLNFLLEDGDLETAQSFRDEYKEQVLALKDEEQELNNRREQLQLLQKQLYETKDSSKSSWLEHVNQAISSIGKKDLVALKSAYRRLFYKVIVHSLERESGEKLPQAKRVGNTKLQLEFIFNEKSTSPNGGVDANCILNWMVVFLRSCTESVLNSQFSIISNAYTTSLFIPEGVLRQKYLVDRLSMQDIAREFSCSKTRIRNLLLKYKIPLRAVQVSQRSQPHLWKTEDRLQNRRPQGRTASHRHYQADVCRGYKHLSYRKVLEHHEDTNQAAGQRLASKHRREDSQARGSEG